MSKKSSIKEQILLKIEEKLLEQNFNEIRMDTIAQELRISKRTIYEIFSSKDEIYEAIIIRFNTLLENKFQKIISDIKKQTISTFDGIGEMIKLISENKKIHCSITAEAMFKFPELIIKMQKRRWKIFDEFLEIAIENNVVRQNLNKKTLHLVLHSTMNALVNPIISKEYEIDFFTAIVEIHKIIIGGILTDEARNNHSVSDFLQNYVY
jgi:AcrR family transcriptional regulator